ncbi:MAG: response regulator transcription factor [Chloroflexi bacterium]|nr:response regulator transcription factor [Chloroflexota bacterium]
MTRVLIVDDQPTFRRQLRALLSHVGFAVVAEARDIPEAEEQVRLHDPDLAVVDLMLPGVNGLEGIPRLKTIAPNLRVILVSAYRDRAGIFRSGAQEAGAEAFVAKDDLDLKLVQAWNVVSKEREGEA